MPYPVAVGRITLPYVINGLTHLMHCWVRNPQDVGGTWMINTRTTDSNDMVWTSGVDALIDTLEHILPTDATIGTALLQTRSGGVFTTVASYVGTLGVVSGGTRVEATQFTMTLRDNLFNRMKVVLLELGLNIPYKLSNPTAGAANVDAYIAEYTENKTLGAAPYVWQVSGWNQYIRPGGFVSATGTDNDKLRRARGTI